MRRLRLRGRRPRAEARALAVVSLHEVLVPRLGSPDLLVGRPEPLAPPPRVPCPPADPPARAPRRPRGWVPVVTDEALRALEREPRDDAFSIERRDRALKRAGLPSIRDGLLAGLAATLRERALDAALTEVTLRCPPSRPGFVMTNIIAMDAPLLVRDLVTNAERSGEITRRFAERRPHCVVVEIEVGAGLSRIGWRDVIWYPGNHEYDAGVSGIGFSLDRGLVVRAPAFLNTIVVAGYTPGRASFWIQLQAEPPAL